MPYKSSSALVKYEENSKQRKMWYAAKYTAKKKKKKKVKKEEAKPNSILGRIKYSKTPPNQCWETYIMPFSQRLPLKENEIKSRRK